MARPPRAQRRAPPRVPTSPPPATRPSIPDAPTKPPRATHTLVALFVVPAVFAVVAGLAWLRAPAPRTPPAEPPPTRDAPLPEGPLYAGEIATRPIEVPLPASSITADECLRRTEAWVFDPPLDAVTRQLRAAGLTDALVARAQAATRCDASECALMPDDALVEALRPDGRSLLYRTLRRRGENRLQVYAYLRDAHFGPWSTMNGLSPAVRDRLARGTWRDGEHYAFSDVPWLCNGLGTDAERIEAMRALRMRYSLTATVTLPRGADLDAITRYWSLGSPADEVHRTITQAASSTRVVPLVELLPPMARARLDRYPSPGEPTRDCFWTAAHFFDGSPRPAPLPDATTAVHVSRWLRTNADEVSAVDARLGDVMALYADDGSLVHTASVVAGDVVFTKNGHAHLRPWALSTRAELLALYPHAPTVRFHRLHR